MIDVVEKFQPRMRRIYLLLNGIVGRDENGRSWAQKRSVGLRPWLAQEDDSLGMMGRYSKNNFERTLQDFKYSFQSSVLTLLELLEEEKTIRQTSIEYSVLTKRYSLVSERGLREGWHFFERTLIWKLLRNGDDIGCRCTVLTIRRLSFNHCAN